MERWCKSRHFWRAICNRGRKQVPSKSESGCEEGQEYGKTDKWLHPLIGVEVFIAFILAIPCCCFCGSCAFLKIKDKTAKSLENQYYSQEAQPKHTTNVGYPPQQQPVYQNVASQGHNM
ncbi:hypothetical protein BT63DRAFT_460643 [Microthyrium microscopicum]|uniref:Uncharacterized protein n=1 Tax=Microthyrium microscopicum TaxID=703497 RepID=A0A6A6TYD2_9PEZI|nr:hypothetical protein BT63DRAFT_460643 [Microthyrium microscopicum]